MLADRGELLFEYWQNESRRAEYEYQRVEAVREAGQYLKPAEQTISSRAYWEQRFAQHPELKPSKVVYYTGDPQTALETWKAQNGLVDTPGKRAVRLDERRVTYGKSKAVQDRFRALAEHVIDRYFQERTLAA